MRSDTRPRPGPRVRLQALPEEIVRPLHPAIPHKQGKRIVIRQLRTALIQAHHAIPGLRVVLYPFLRPRNPSVRQRRPARISSQQLQNLRRHARLRSQVRQQSRQRTCHGWPVQSPRERRCMLVRPLAIWKNGPAHRRDHRVERMVMLRRHLDVDCYVELRICRSLPHPDRYRPLPIDQASRIRDKLSLRGQSADRTRFRGQRCAAVRSRSHAGFRARSIGRHLRRVVLLRR